MWYQAITEIQKVRKDIKLQKNKKKIVNLPMKELKQNVYQICEVCGCAPLPPRLPLHASTCLSVLEAALRANNHFWKMELLMLCSPI